MKISFCLLFFFLFPASYSLEQADSVKSKLKAGATVSLNSNGIASIPAFSLDKPAIIAAIVLAKGRFSYEPTLAYGPELKPWTIDNWLNFKIIRRQAFTLITGFNVSAFFSDYKQGDETILRGQRYFTFALTGVYSFAHKTTLTMAYWNDNGQDQGLKGHYFNLAAEKSEISIWEHVLLSAALQVFYINYDGKNDGLFITPKISFSVRNFPLSIYFQGIQAIKSNISPFPGFNWNVGLAYRF